MQQNNDFERFSADWVDTPEYNDYIYREFEKAVDGIPYLKAHDEIVGRYNLGYGEKAFRYVWYLLMSQLEGDSKFLEIGVYKGSILALSQLIARELKLDVLSYGLTPLNTTGDKYSRYDPDDFGSCIAYLYHLLELSTDNTRIIEGLSTDPVIKDKARLNGSYDIIYVDGGHDYETVVSDIELCHEILKPNGFLVLDDASSFLHFKPTHPGFDGHPDVGRAVSDTLEQDDRYRHLFACGHNRVWRKIK